MSKDANVSQLSEPQVLFANIKNKELIEITERVDMLTLATSRNAAKELSKRMSSKPKRKSASLEHSLANDNNDDDEDLKGNPIGTLQELCMMRRWMPPEYKMDEEMGLPHQRSFTMVCQVKDYTEYGRGRSKKIAKRRAAQRMVQRVFSIPVDLDEISYKLNEEEEEDAFSERCPTGKNKLLNANRKISMIHKNLKGLIGPKLEQLKNLPDSELESVDAITWIKRIASENKLEMFFVSIEEISKSGKYQCLAQISSKPVIICQGIADSRSGAQIQSAIQALRHIKLLSV